MCLYVHGHIHCPFIIIMLGCQWTCCVCMNVHHTHSKSQSENGVSFCSHLIGCTYVRTYVCTYVLLCIAALSSQMVEHQFIHMGVTGTGINVYTCTVWPEILAGRYFGGLLKICHLAEFTLAVELGLAIMIFITKWLLKRAGILTLPLASFRSVRTKSMIKCN